MSELREYLLSRATPGRWSLEPDAATDRSDEEMALEVVRENIFRRFYEGMSGMVVRGRGWSVPCRTLWEGG